MKTIANSNGPSADVTTASDIDPLLAVSRLPVFGRTGDRRPVGIALAFADDDSDLCGEDRFDLLMVDAGNAVIARLGPFCEEEVVALWRDCSAKSGLPRMIVKEDGALAVVSAQLGPVALGRTRMRRRVGLLNGRRPRFLVRRKTGTLPVRPLIHRESEIISGARC